MFEQFFSYHLEGWSTPSGILSQGQVGIRERSGLALLTLGMLGFPCMMQGW